MGPLTIVNGIHGPFTVNSGILIRHVLKVNISIRFISDGREERDVSLVRFYHQG